MKAEAVVPAIIGFPGGSGKRFVHEMICDSISYYDRRRMMHLWLAVLCMAVPCLTEAMNSALPVVQLKTGGHLITAEVAATLETRDIGLTNRRSLPVDHGMLFVFPEARRHCMWMRDTHIPLSVAFLDDAGTIINIEDMQPDTGLHHCAARPVRYALEMETGWFQKQGLAAGSQIRGLKKAPPGR